MGLRVGRHPILGDMNLGHQVTIYVDGRPIQALEGEPIAAALYAAGIRTTRFSAHAGEPRGPFCMIGRCNECSMVVNGDPHVKTCLTPVSDGMRVDTPKGAVS